MSHLPIDPQSNTADNINTQFLSERANCDQSAPETKHVFLSLSLLLFSHSTMLCCTYVSALVTQMSAQRQPNLATIDHDDSSA